LSVEEGGGTMELVPSGRDVEVTAQNVYDYVRKYAEYRMIKAQEKAIEVVYKRLIFFSQPTGKTQQRCGVNFTFSFNGNNKVR
jgi:E3 ubiquitin-protein ligase EDD1